VNASKISSLYSLFIYYCRSKIPNNKIIVQSNVRMKIGYKDVVSDIMIGRMSALSESIIARCTIIGQYINTPICESSMLDSATHWVYQSFFLSSFIY
jgi:hypothetical protein